MPRTSPGDIELQDVGPVASRETDLADMTVSYLTFIEETDTAPILASLPTGSCQCAHWGALTSGHATVRYDDGRSEEIGPGDAYT